LVFLRLCPREDRERIILKETDGGIQPSLKTVFEIKNASQQQVQEAKKMASLLVIIE